MEHSRGLGSRLALSIPWGHHSRRDAACPLHAPVSWLRVSLPVRRPQLDQLCISRAPSLTSAAAGAEPRGHKGHTSLQYSSLHPEACFKRKDMNHTKALSHKMLWFLDFLFELGVAWNFITSILPPRHAHGDLTSLEPHDRLPEILVVPLEKTPTGAAARGNP